MSNIVFPMPKPPQGSWIYPVKKTPRWKTLIQTPASERGEVRIPLMLTPVYDFEYDFSYLKGDFQTLGSALSNLVGFYERMNGAGDDWLFQDPYDNGATAISITNGDFEISNVIPPVGWLLSNAISLSYDTSTQFQGARSLIVTAGSGNGARSINYPCQAGQTISASCMAKFIGGASSTACSMFLEFYDINGARIGTPPGASTSVTDWTPLTTDATAPAGTASFLVFLGVTNGTGGQGEFDVVTSQVMTIGPQQLGYGDGTTTQFQIGRILGSNGFEMMQNVFPTALFIGGTPVPAGPQPSGNQWYCGMENLIGYSQDFTQSAYWNTFSEITPTAAATTAPDGTNTGNKLARNSSGGTYEIGQICSPIIAPGEKLTFSAWMKQGTSGVQGQLIVDFKVGNAGSFGNGVSGTGTSGLNLTSGWRRFSLTVTVPPGATQAFVYFGLLSTVNPGDFIYAWGAQVERWPSPNSYVVTTNNPPQFPRGLATVAIAPTFPNAVTADFSYYYRCRFGDDSWTDLDEMLYQIWELRTMKFSSLIL